LKENFIVVDLRVNVGDFGKGLEIEKLFRQPKGLNREEQRISIKGLRKDNGGIVDFFDVNRKEVEIDG